MSAERIKHYPGLCDCCRRHGIVGVASSGYGPISFGWCMQCLRLNVEPEWVLAYLYWDVGNAGEGLISDESLPGTWRDGRYWTWREWADKFAEEFRPPPEYWSGMWTGRETVGLPQWFQRIIDPMDSTGGSVPGYKLPRWRLALRRFAKFWFLWPEGHDEYWLEGRPPVYHDVGWRTDPLDS